MTIEAFYLCISICDLECYSKDSGGLFIHYIVEFNLRYLIYHGVHLSYCFVFVYHLIYHLLNLL